MKPKEKAKEIYEKMLYWQLGSVKINTPSVAKVIAQQSSIIVIDEMINYLNHIILQEYGHNKIDIGQSYWQEVKQEINKL